MRSFPSDALTTNLNFPVAAAFTVHVMSLVWSPCVTCEEPLPVSVQREGTNRNAPLTVWRPPTCHRCVSVCWYPGPVVPIVHDAAPDQRAGAAAPPAPAWIAAATTAEAVTPAATSELRDMQAVSHRPVAFDRRRLGRAAPRVDEPSQRPNLAH